MDKFRVKAFFMHKHERQAAKDAETASTIEGAEWTDSYVMGVVKESEIKPLTDKGLVVSVIEKVVSEPSSQMKELAMEPLTTGPAIH